MTQPNIYIHIYMNMFNAMKVCLQPLVHEVFTNNNLQADNERKWINQKLKNTVKNRWDCVEFFYVCLCVCVCVCVGNSCILLCVYYSS